MNSLTEAKTLRQYTVSRYIYMGQNQLTIPVHFPLLLPVNLNQLQVCTILSAEGLATADFSMARLLQCKLLGVLGS